MEKAVLVNPFPMALGRIGRPEDVASAVAFLCSDPAGYITGVNPRIDGGVIPTVC